MMFAFPYYFSVRGPHKIKPKNYFVSLSFFNFIFGSDLRVLHACCVEDGWVHTYDQVGTFTIALTAEFTVGCVETFTRTVEITKGYKLVNPTAFTPNGDGYNETIRPSHRGFTSLNMIIYDTWGTTIYTEEGLDLRGWNGFANEKPAENGNYVMLVKGITFFGKEIIISSPVTLLK